MLFTKYIKVSVITGLNSSLLRHTLKKMKVQIHTQTVYRAHNISYLIKKIEIA